MGAIDHDAHAVEPRIARKSALGEFDIARLAVVNALGAADLAVGGEAGFQAAIHQAFNFHFDGVGQFLAVGTEKLDAIVVIGIVRGGDHHAQIGAQAARQHGDGGGGQRAELEHIHAHGGEARDQGAFDHVAGEARILADHHAVAMGAAGEDAPGGHAGLHGDFGCQGCGVDAATNAVGAKIFAGHGMS